VYWYYCLPTPPPLPPLLPKPRTVFQQSLTAWNSSLQSFRTNPLEDESEGEEGEEAPASLSLWSLRWLCWDCLETHAA